MVYICILNLIYNYVSRILLWTTFEFSAFWCSNWTYNVDFMKHVVVCFNLNLSIFVKQLLSEDQDCGLIYKNVMDLINQMHINKMFTKKLI